MGSRAVRRAVTFLVACLFAACGTPSPAKMAVRHWIALDQTQRDEVLQKLPGAPYGRDCEETLYTRVVLGKVGPAIMDAPLLDVTRLVCPPPHPPR